MAQQAGSTGGTRGLETRRIGSLEVTVVGVGCNNFGRRTDERASEAVVNAALEAGINFFDTADVYGSGKSEEFLGKALGKGRRDSVLIATKFGHQVDDTHRGGARPEYIRIAVEESLRRLGTDTIDLYQQHRPDPEVPIEDTLAALNDLVQAGKVREIGASNFSADLLGEAAAVVRAGAARFVSVQNHYSLLHREPEQTVLPAAERLGMGFLPYFPLANGLLTGKFRRGQARPEGTRLSEGERADKILSEQNLDVVERLIEFAGARGHTVLELAFSWLLAHPAVASVIAGATSPAQIHGNAAAAGWRLSDAELAEIDRIVQPATGV